MLEARTPAAPADTSTLMSHTPPAGSEFRVVVVEKVPADLQMTLRRFRGGSQGTGGEGNGVTSSDGSSHPWTEGNRLRAEC